MSEAKHPFDVFFDAAGYKDGEEPQAFADWLAAEAGHRIVGISEDGAVEGHPPEVPARGEQ